MAYVSHVLPPCLTGSYLPEVRSVPPRLRRVGSSTATAHWRDPLRGRWPRLRAMRRGEWRPLQSSSPLKRKEGERPSSSFPILAHLPLLLLVPLVIRRFFFCILVVFGVVFPPTGNRTSMASSGARMGSGVSNADIRKLRRGQFLGTAEVVAAHAPDLEEISSTPKEGEFVVFATHLEWGLGLPTSPFFQEFLRFYG